MVVLDCSAAMAMIKQDEMGRGLESFILEGEKVIAPALFRAELGNTLWQYVRAGIVAEQEISGYIEMAMGLVDAFVDESELLPQAVQEAVRFGHPVYDMIYLVLARHKAATLFTLDQKLMAVCREAGVSCIETMKLRNGKWV